MWTTTSSRLAFLCFIVLSSRFAEISAEDNSGVPLNCGDRNSAQMIDVTSNFTSLSAGAVCEDHYCDFLMPKEIHWHIYPIPEGSEPRQSMQPEGLLKPQVRNGVLSYQLQDILESRGYVSGQKIQAGINLYIPIDRLSSIAISGVDQFVQIHADNEEIAGTEREEALIIATNAVDSHVIVTSPYWKVDFSESGVDNQIYIDAAAGSSLDASGVDMDAQIRCPEGLTLRTRGVDSDISIEGPLYFGSMEGVDADIEINDGVGTNPCANVTNTGVGNRCDDTDDVFESTNLTCLADTKVGYQCYWPLSTAAQVGIGAGLFILFVAVLAASIFGCIRCCCNEKYKQAHAPRVAVVPNYHRKADSTFKGEEASHGNTVIEAEVLDVKDDFRGDGMVGAGFHNVDLELAKDERLA